VDYIIYNLFNIFLSICVNITTTVLTDVINCKNKETVLFLIFIDSTICNCILHNNIMFINNVDYLLTFIEISHFCFLMQKFALYMTITCT